MSYLSYLSPVAHEISSRRRQICRRVLHGYFHPICRRIASECMMVISSGQCVFVVSLFIDSGSVLFLPIVNIRHWPLTWDMWHRSSSSWLLMLAVGTAKLTQCAWWLMWWLLSSVTCDLMHPRYSPVTTTLSLVFVGPGPVHESLSLEFFNFDINMQWWTKYYKTYCKR